MSDSSPIDDRPAPFDQQQSSPTVTTPTKSKMNESFENFSTQELDPFGNHHGNGMNTQEYHSSNGSNKDEHHNGTNGNKHEELDPFARNNDPSPVDTSENEQGKLTLFKVIFNQYFSFLFFKFLLMITNRIIRNFQHGKMKNPKIRRSISIPIRMEIKQIEIHFY